MKRKPEGWRNEPTRHSLSAHGVHTGSRGIGKKAKMYGHHFTETLHPRTLESTYVHRDLNLYKNDIAYEALESTGWSQEDAYDMLNSELDILKKEYEASKDENIKLRINVIQQAKVVVADQSEYEWLKNEWPTKREKLIEKYYGDQMQSSGRPIVLDNNGKESFDGDDEYDFDYDFDYDYDYEFDYDE